MKSAIKDHMTTLVTITVLACVTKFLMQGVTFDVFGHAINLGSADALTYGALLTPVLGAHGYMTGKYRLETKEINAREEGLVK